jgi:hypothetical protein
MTLTQLLTWTAPFCACVAFLAAAAAWGIAQARLRTSKGPLLAAAVEAARETAATDQAATAAEVAAAGTPAESQDGSDEIARLASLPGSTLGPRLTLVHSGVLTQRARVTAGSAWTASDSWLTTITGIFGVGSGVVLSLASTHGGAQVAFLFTIYAVNAALAPIVYGALGVSSPDTGQVTGTVAGYLGAGALTVFGSLGEIATVCLLGMQANPQVQVRVPVWIVGIVLAVAIVIYSLRSMIAVLVTDTHAAGPTQPVASAVVDAARAAVGESVPATRPGSLLVGYSARRSATL